MKKYIVELSSNERCELEEMIRVGKAAAYKIKHANILLKADQTEGDGPAWRDEQIAEAFGCHEDTVANARKRFVIDGFDAAIERRREGVGRPRRLDGDAEATLTMIACSEPPKGRLRWTVALLADRLVELRVVDACSPATVCRDEKNELKPWRNKSWVIPPKASGEFVAAMEDVLEVYKRRANVHRPVVCLDETSKQLVAETREPIPMRPGEPKRFDYEYRRCGVANLFMMFEPLAAWRRVIVTERRTRVDFAHCVRELVDEWYPNARKIILVMDNLNTHSIGSLYDAFDPDEAHRIARKLEIHHTPKHGSWLNMAEIELSVLARQVLCDRIPDIDALTDSVAIWEDQRNTADATVNWRFTTSRARIKLKRLYPEILLQ